MPVEIYFTNADAPVEEDEDDEITEADDTADEEAADTDAEAADESADTEATDADTTADTEATDADTTADTETTDEADNTENADNTAKKKKEKQAPKPLNTTTRCGQNIQTTVPMRSIKSSIIKYFMIIKSLYSGFI